MASGLPSKNLIREILTEAINPNLEKAAAHIIPGLRVLLSQLKIIKRGAAEAIRASNQAALMPQIAERSWAENPKAQNLLSKQA